MKKYSQSYPIRKHVLAGLVLCSALLSCGDGGTNPADVALSPDFKIELVFITRGTPSQDAAFQTAADRWMDILSAELSDVDFSSNAVPADTCIQGQPAVSDTVDDLRVFVSISPLDGVLGTLAQAGPCQVRSSTQLPVLGFIQLDAADVARLEQDSALADVTLHEMGHVLGIGTLWDRFDTLLINPSLPSNSGADTHFAGMAAIAAFDAAGGTSYTGGGKVPVENQLGEGSSDSHWRESVLALELMTPELAPGFFNPLSAITAQSLADLGYGVDSSQADSFAEAFSAPARMIVPRRRVINLRNDTQRGPLQAVDEAGHVIKTVPWR